MRTIIQYFIISIFVGILLLTFELVGGITVIQEWYLQEKNSGLSFSFSSCDKNNNEESSETEVIWHSNNEVSIKKIINPNRGTIWIFGNYELHNNQLKLLYKPVLNSAMACTCSNSLEYTIKGIPKAEYEIKVELETEIDAVPYWFYDLLFTP